MKITGPTNSAITDRLSQSPAVDNNARLDGQREKFLDAGSRDNTTGPPPSPGAQTILATPVASTSLSVDAHIATFSESGLELGPDMIDNMVDHVLAAFNEPQ